MQEIMPCYTKEDINPMYPLATERREENKVADKRIHGAALF